MKFPTFRSPLFSQVSSWNWRASAAFVLLLSIGSAHSATTYYWDANGGTSGTGGSGTWDTTNSLWREGSSGGTLSQWPSADPSSSIARFEGTAGIVTLDGTTIYANGLSFGDQDWVIRSSNSSSKLVLNGTSPSINLGSPSTGRTFAFNTQVELSSGTTAVTKSGGAGIAIMGVGVAPTTSASGTSSLTTASGGILNLASSSNRIRLTVGRQNDLATQAVSSQFDLSGGQVAAYLNSLQLGWRTIDTAGSGTGNVSATVDFGTHASSIVNVDSGTSALGAIGYLELNNNSAAYTGSVEGTLNLGGGTNTFTSSATGGVATLYVGQATRRLTSATNGTNLASATGTMNISGGTTTISATGSGNANAIALASRDAALGVNTTAAGTLNLTGGTLNVSGDDIYGGGGTSTVTLNGGTLNLGGGNLGRSGGLITNLNFESGTLSNVNQINNGAALNKTTLGTLILSGTNTYTGATTISEGTLSASNIVVSGGNSHLGNATSAVGLGAGATKGTLSYSGNTATYTRGFTLGNGGGQLDVTTSGQTLTVGTGAITGTAGLLTVGGAGNTTITSAITTTTGGLTKTGAGTLTLTNSGNTFTGTTLVSGGTLILSGSGSIANSATVDVAAGATLSTSGITFGTGQMVKGKGTITGNTILQGTLAAGNSPGILTFNDDLTLASSTDSIFEIENTGMVRGTDYDGVNVLGMLTYDGTLTLSMTSLISNGTYNLFDFTSIAGDFDTVVFDGGIYAGTFTQSGGFWTATDTNGSGQVFSFGLASGDLIVLAIPEPSTPLLLTVGLMTLLFFRRRSSGKLS